MWTWFRRGRAERGRVAADEELKGAPAQARTKTFSAESGFVYQYVYRGYRRMHDGLGAEHVFEARRSRGQQFSVTVRLLDSEVARCREAIGRDLIGAERYALVKMSLFGALDAVVEVAELEKPLVPDANAMEAHLRVLGRI